MKRCLSAGKNSEAAVVGPSRTQGNGAFHRIVGFLLLLFLFTAVQVFHFHRRILGQGLSVQLSFELPDNIEARAVQPYIEERSRQQMSVLYSFITGHENWNETPHVTKNMAPFRRGRNRGRGKGKKPGFPIFLKDLTNAELYKDFKSTSIPLVSKLKLKHPNMKFLAIPTDRWPQIDNHTCIPSNRTFEESDFRTPYALILGAQKAGSSALAEYLYSHTQIVPTRKELHFLSERMDFYNDEFGGIHQEKARSHYLRHIENATIELLLRAKSNESTSKMHVVDATPMYLPKSDRVPYRVLCLCPWARLIVILREPTSRTFSHYNMDKSHVDIALTKKTNSVAKQMLKIRLGTFDEFIQRDYDLLTDLGILLPENATESERKEHYGSKKESDAWKVYTKLGTVMPIGRSLYVIQLRHWMRAYKARNQTLRLLVLNSEEMKSNTASVYQKVLDFLELPQEIPQQFEEHHKHDYGHMEPMSNATRDFLERIFEPYNRQLRDLLGPEWEGIWQYSQQNVTIDTE